MRLSNRLLRMRVTTYTCSSAARGESRRSAPVQSSSCVECCALLPPEEQSKAISIVPARSSARGACALTLLHRAALAAEWQRVSSRRRLPAGRRPRACAGSPPNVACPRGALAKLLPAAAPRRVRALPPVRARSLSPPAIVDWPAADSSWGGAHYTDQRPHSMCPARTNHTPKIYRRAYTKWVCDKIHSTNAYIVSASVD